MVRKFPFAHVVGVGILLCCRRTGAITSAFRMSGEAFIAW